MKNSISDSFDVIMLHSHLFNWGTDWQIVQDVYEAFPNSFSVLTPFAYSYLEELIRSNTQEYGIELYDEKGKAKQRQRGINLINLAIAENKQKSSEFLILLEELKKYYYNSTSSDTGNNRHSVVHGYMHPRFWTKESFEKLIYDIARLSKYAAF